MRGKLGRVVPMVAEAEEKNDEMSVMFSVSVVTLLRGNSPIVGGSFPLMPKLTRDHSVFQRRNAKRTVPT
jgi:hypothetical protein